jgi:hypothetical protein
MTTKERVPTATRSAIRVVVRGLPLPEGGKFQIGDLSVLIVARARAADWPESTIDKGDLDGVVWVAPELAFASAAELQKDEHIIAVRVDLSA